MRKVLGWVLVLSVSLATLVGCAQRTPEADAAPPATPVPSATAIPTLEPTATPTSVPCSTQLQEVEALLQEWNCPAAGQ